MDSNRKIDNEEQLVLYLKEAYDLSPGRYEIIKSACKYLELDENVTDIDFETIKNIFNVYITKGISEQKVIDGFLLEGSLSALRSTGIIDDNNSLTEKGFQTIKVVSFHLKHL